MPRHQRHRRLQHPHSHLTLVYHAQLARSHTSQAFSEKALVKKTVRDLEKLPAEAGRVTAVIHSEMFGEEAR